MINLMVMVICLDIYPLVYHQTWLEHAPSWDNHHGGFSSKPCLMTPDSGRFSDWSHEANETGEFCVLFFFHSRNSPCDSHENRTLFGVVLQSGTAWSSGIFLRRWARKNGSLVTGTRMTWDISILLGLTTYWPSIHIISSASRFVDKQIRNKSP